LPTSGESQSHGTQQQCGQSHGYVRSCTDPDQLNVQSSSHGCFLPHLSFLRQIDTYMYSTVCLQSIRSTRCYVEGRTILGYAPLRG
jgi:hypothetical protein